jgi:dTDP-4-amino-4,6-dideoxygalactose transaminase
VQVKHGGRHVGSFGDVGCFSTYIAHLLVTGVGGVATTNNPQLASIMRSLINHGIDLTELPTGSEYDTSWLSRKFRFSRVGHSFRMTELEAALGLSQLELLTGFVAIRQFNTAYLNDGLATCETFLQLPKQRDFTRSSCMMYPLVCLQGNRDNFAKYLNQAGIETRLMLPLIGQPAYAGMWDTNKYPVAKWIDENGLYIGCHHDLSKDDLDYVILMIKDFYQ